MSKDSDDLDLLSRRTMGKAAMKAVIAEFKAIRAREPLTAAAVLKRARDPKNPLHRFFEWDDSAAAERFRLIQASRLVRDVRLVIDTPSGEQRSVRAFLHVVTDRGHCYEPTLEVMESPRLSAQVIDEIRQSLDHLQRKMETYEELRDARRLVVKASKKLPRPKKSKKAA